MCAVFTFYQCLFLWFVMNLYMWMYIYIYIYIYIFLYSLCLYVFVNEIYCKLLSTILYVIGFVPVLFLKMLVISSVLILDMVTGFFCKWCVAVVVVTLLDVMHRTNTLIVITVKKNKGIVYLFVYLNASWVINLLSCE